MNKTVEGFCDKLFITNKTGNRIAKRICPRNEDEKFFDRFFRYSIIPFIFDFDRKSFSPEGRRKVDIELSHYCFNYMGVTMALSAIVEALYYGYVPMVDVQQKGVFNWTDYFEQPFEIDPTEIVEVYPRNVGGYKWNGLFIENELDIKAWYKIYREFYRLNSRSAEYVDGEYRELLGSGKEKSVLGVLCRGTDYARLKPKGHFIQPEIETIIDEVKGLTGSGRFKYIYLASEDGSLADVIKKAFPGMVLENKRVYFDQAYYDGEHNKLGDLYSEMSDSEIRKKDLSYISSINILSKCGGLVAGNCGGSQAAVCINGGKYDYCHVYNLGVY